MPLSPCYTTCAAQNLNLFINLTTGTDASPSWLFYAEFDLASGR